MHCTACTADVQAARVHCVSDKPAGCNRLAGGYLYAEYQRIGRRTGNTTAASATVAAAVAAATSMVLLRVLSLLRTATNRVVPSQLPKNPQPFSALCC